LEKISEASQEETEDEHYEECFNTFNQEAEKKETTTLNLAAEEVEEQADRLITPWDMELEILEDWLNNTEPAGDCHEQILEEDHSEESLRIFSQGVEKVMKTAEMNSVAEWTLSTTK
jgi:hypothetical protein